MTGPRLVAPFLRRFAASLLAFAAAGSPSLAASTGLKFVGTNAYVGFGNPAPLGLSTFTVECWFRRDGPGVTVFTGSGGLGSTVPLVTKGRGEEDGDNRDMNYFLGLKNSFLGIDFEEGAAGSSPGQNHSVTGVTPLTTGVWYHAAATYDRSRLQLFLNGALEAQSIVNQPPRFDSEAPK